MLFPCLLCKKMTLDFTSDDFKSPLTHAREKKNKLEYKGDQIYFKMLGNICKNDVSISISSNSSKIQLLINILHIYGPNLSKNSLLKIFLFPARFFYPS